MVDLLALASDLAINPNTIARAYQELQSDLVLEPLRGRGLIVRRDSIPRCRKARNALVEDGVRRALADAIAGGMTPQELRELFEFELTRLAPQDHSAEKAG